MKPWFVLRNWSVITDRIGNLRVSGDVFNNPKFDDGTRIVTSKVINLTYTDPGYVLTTLNSIYQLEEE